MLALSTYFTIDVEVRRRALFGSAQRSSVATGDVVVLGRAIDGDEVSVLTAAGETLTVRLLGVKAFEHTNQPGLGDPGARATDELARFVGQEATVTIGDVALDGADRLLAYLEVGETDLGARLLDEGWVLAYTRFAFDRQDAYRSLEQAAREARRGLWASPRATERALGMRASWESER